AGGSLMMVGVGPAGTSAFPGTNGKIAFVEELGGSCGGSASGLPGEPGFSDRAAVPMTTATTSPSPGSTAPGAAPGAGAQVTVCHSQIFVMNPDGSAQTNLSNNSFSDFEPVWSADGGKIVFASSRTGHDQIFVMNADGSGQTNLSNNASTDVEPTW